MPAQVFDREQALEVATITQLMVPNSKIFSVSNTGSMKPMIDEQCLVVVVYDAFETINVHDVIVYFSSEIHRNVIHRVMEKRSDGKLWTLGDNNKRPDNEFVTRKNYVGKVCTVVYYHGDSIPSGLVVSMNSR